MTPAREAKPRRASVLHEAAWPDMLANLQAAYTELTQTQFELERRAAEAAEARDLFQRVVESMSEALFLLDRAGHIVRLNPAACALLRLDEAAMLGRPLDEVCRTNRIHETSVTHSAEALVALPTTPWQLLKRAPNGTLTDVEVVIACTGGRNVPVSASCTLVRDRSGKITGLLVVARDVTERKRAEAERAASLAQEQAARAEAEAALRIREEFLSVAAHELKTPLTTLLGSVQGVRRLADQGKMDSDRARRVLATAERQASRLARLVTQLFDVSQLESGKLVLDRQVVDLGQLVREAVEDARVAAPRRQLVLRSPRTSRVEAAVDPLRMEQVVRNLLDNAVKYSPDDQKIDVAVAQPSPEVVRISVRDRGIGIPPEHRARVFERLYQAHSGREAGYRSGMGIGLYVAREIVELHGGRIQTESPRGGGTRFVVTLPRTPVAQHGDQGVDAGSIR
ncbi:MAG TPA: PAS domain-containing sensor histidine kinase [Chloroflexota bacterium]|nr:PAS domain-containing sensor histidine kinase [Chloroflexota bacterium]